MKVTIIGGGISGVSIARMLQKNNIDFIILEKENDPGGLCRTININNHLLDIGGGHFFCSKYEEVYNFIFEHIPVDNFNKYKRVSKINIEGNIIDYPVESNINQLPFDLFFEYLESIFLSGNRIGVEEPKKYIDWIKWKLGEKIANNYMIPYNQKIWGNFLSDMNTDWLYKIPNIPLKELVRNFIKPSNEAKFYPSHYTFYYPKKGGFQLIFDSIFKRISDKLKTNYKITDIENIDSKWIINNEIESDIVINTAPWMSIGGALKNNETLKDISTLRYNSIVVSLYEEKYSHNYHWIYEPDLSKNHHRSFFINNFSQASAPNGVYDETNVYRFKNNKKYIYSYSNEFAYPISVVGEKIKKIIKFYESKNFYGLGRWGQWQYFNSDVCILEGLKLLKKILEGSDKCL
jgi:protoporphyrinogen oxidase